MRVRVSLRPASVMHSRQEIGMHCSDWGNQLYAVFSLKQLLLSVVIKLVFFPLQHVHSLAVAHGHVTSNNENVYCQMP